MQNQRAETTCRLFLKIYICELQVYLNGIGPEVVHIELYAEKSNGGSPFRLEMAREET